MDPLGLLSDDSDDSEDEEAVAQAAPAVTKKTKVDFESLCAAGYRGCAHPDPRARRCNVRTRV
jgi:hypothetical protein